MARPHVPDRINDYIDQLWVEEVKLAQKEKRKPKAAAVWRAVNGVNQARKSETKLPRDKQKVSLSHVEKRVRWLEKQRRLSALEENPQLSWEAFEWASAEAIEREVAAIFTPPEWVPWVNPSESPEETLFLIGVNAAKQAIYRQSLFQREAEWGRKLRPAIGGLPPISQYRLVEMYAERQVSADYLKRPPYTADLDGVVAYRAWLPKNQPVYELAVAAGLVPFPWRPPVLPPISAGDSDLDEFMSTTIYGSEGGVPGFPFLTYLSEHPTGDTNFDNLISRFIDEVTLDFPFLTYMSEHPQDFSGWSSLLVVERIEPPPVEELAGSAGNGVDPGYIQMVDQFLKFWSGIQTAGEEEDNG